VTKTLTPRELAIAQALRRELELDGNVRPEFVHSDENVLKAAPMLLEVLGRERREFRELRGAAREVHEAIAEGCLYLDPPRIVEHGPDDPRDLVFDETPAPLRLKRDAALVRILCARAGKLEVSLRAVRGALLPETLEIEP
jgi:hypothetical protein